VLYLVDREERLERETREKIKELIARRQARQWMKRIDRDLQEIRDTRSIIQTKIINIEATLEGKWLELLIVDSHFSDHIHFFIKILTFTNIFTFY